MRDAPSSEPLLRKAAPNSSPLRRLGLLLLVGVPLYALSIGAAYAYGRAKVAEQVDAAVAAELSETSALTSTRATLEQAIPEQERFRDSYVAERAKLEAELRVTPEEEVEAAKAKLQTWLDAERGQ